MSRTYVQTAAQIISAAFQKTGLLAEEQLLNNNQFDRGLVSLGNIINFLAEKEVLPWFMTWGTQGLTASSAVSSGGKYYRCIRSHVSAAGTQPETGSLWTDVWYEDSSVSGSAVPWIAATSYSCIADFLFQSANAVMQSFFRYQGRDYPVKIRQFCEFLVPEEKWRTGIPEFLFFDRLGTYRLYLNPIPEFTVGILHLLYINHLPEPEIGADPAPIPPGWIDPLTYLLAANVADEAGLSVERCAYLQAKANSLLQQVRMGAHVGVTDETRIKSCY